MEGGEIIDAPWKNKCKRVSLSVMRYLIPSSKEPMCGFESRPSKIYLDKQIDIV